MSFTLDELAGLTCDCGAQAELLNGDYAMCNACYDRMVDAIMAGRRLAGDAGYRLTLPYDRTEPASA